MTMPFLASSACSNFVSHNFSFVYGRSLVEAGTSSDNETSFDGKERFGLLFLIILQQ